MALACLACGASVALRWLSGFQICHPIPIAWSLTLISISHQAGNFLKLLFQLVINYIKIIFGSDSGQFQYQGSSAGADNELLDLQPQFVFQVNLQRQIEWCQCTLQSRSFVVGLDWKLARNISGSIQCLQFCNWTWTNCYKTGSQGIQEYFPWTSLVQQKNLQTFYIQVVQS